MLIQFFIVFLANYLIVFFALPLCLLFIHHKVAFLKTSLSAVLAWLVGFLLKNFFYLPRPFILGRVPLLIHFLMDGSFPSIHTAVAFAISFSVFRFFRRTGLLLLFFSLLIAGSRVVVGVHSPLDVSAGMIIGLFASQAVFLIPGHFEG